MSGGLLAIFVFFHEFNSDATVTWRPVWFVGGLAFGIVLICVIQFTEIGRRFEASMQESRRNATAVLLAGLLLVVAVVPVLQPGYDGDVLTGMLGLAASSAVWGIVLLRHGFSSSRIPDAE